MDAFRHLNNVRYFRYFETSRIHLLRVINFHDGGGDQIGPILKRIDCTFRVPVMFPQTLIVGAAPHTISSDRFHIKHIAVLEGTNTVVAESDSVIVSYDYAKATKSPLPSHVVENLKDLNESDPKLF